MLENDHYILTRVLSNQVFLPSQNSFCQNFATRRIEEVLSEFLKCPWKTLGNKTRFWSNFLDTASLFAISFSNAKEFNNWKIVLNTDVQLFTRYLYQTEYGTGRTARENRCHQKYFYPLAITRDYFMMSVRNAKEFLLVQKYIIRLLTICRWGGLTIKENCFSQKTYWGPLTGVLAITRFL